MKIIDENGRDSYNSDSDNYLQSPYCMSPHNRTLVCCIYTWETESRREPHIIHSTSFSQRKLSLSYVAFASLALLHLSQGAEPYLMQTSLDPLDFGTLWS